MSALQPSTPVAVFCAFAQPDLSSCLKLEEALIPAQRAGILTLWHEDRIAGGMDRTQTIEAQFSRATLILLLISPKFLASNECYDLAQRAFQRRGIFLCLNMAVFYNSERGLQYIIYTTTRLRYQ